MGRSSGQVVLVLVSQLLIEAGVALAVWWSSGTLGLLLPIGAGGVFLGVYGFTSRIKRAVSRRSVRKMSVGVGLVHMPPAGLLYGYAWTLQPELYDFSERALPLAALMVSLLVGVSAFVVATCALDLSIHAAGGFVDGETTSAGGLPPREARR